MRAVRIPAWTALLGVSIAGCAHSGKNQQSAQAQAPPLQTDSGTPGQSAIAQQQEKSSAPPPSLPTPATPTAPPALPPPPRKKVKKARAKTAKPAATSAETAASPAPSNASPSSLPQSQTAAVPGGAASPIGQLTAGESAGGGQTRSATAKLIHETEEGLASIKRSLSPDEQITAGQIRTFLKQAKQALDNGDSDGAHTLATKAKLLLDELTKR